MRLIMHERLQVDIHIMTKPPVGDWICFGTETTDSGGRVTYTIPKEKQLPQGMYPVKMVVRWDFFDHFVFTATDLRQISRWRACVGTNFCTFLLHCRLKIPLQRRSHFRGLLLDSTATQDRMRCIFNRRFVHSQCVYHGQGSQSSSGCCRRCQVITKCPFHPNWPYWKMFRAQI